MTSLLKTKNLTKQYGKKGSVFKALDGVDLDIKKGESVAIVGKSGSGKSTLMHLLALLDTPTEGQIFLNGEEMGQLSSRQVDKLRNKTFGFVFQQFFLNGNRSALENATLPLKIGGVSKRARNERGMEVLKSVDMLDKAKSKAKELSGGQKQRVVIARALINNPSVIFADEPTGNLDSHTGSKIEGILFDLNKKEGISLIIVTHDPDLANKCDRQIHLLDGRIVVAKKVKKRKN